MTAGAGARRPDARPSLRPRPEQGRWDTDGGGGPLGRIDEVVAAEVVVVGAGAAGLTAALGCAPRAVTLVTKSRLGEGGSTAWAQGGIAAAVGAGDSPRLHAADTLAVAGGLGDRRAVDLLTGDGPARMAALLALGARFDRADDGRLALGREAAHGRRRILHARGDATGAELVRTLAAAVRRAPEVRLAEEETAIDLALDRGRVVGVTTVDPYGRRRLHLAPAVVLATGGLGQLYLRTTNPVESTADGLAMAARAGARLVDLEFVQFHPTALDAGRDPMPLLTEALRGEGAAIVDSRGRRFLAGEHPAAELAPRDLVARAIWRRLAAGERVFLDARAAVGEAFPERFPTVWAACREAGLDPRREPIPVAPAAHYHMGGVAVDLRGRSSLPGLWACGEVASTGVHGANRLASNSLLEALVFGARVAADLRGRLAALPGARPDDLTRLRVGGSGLGADGRAVGAGGTDRAAEGAPERPASMSRRTALRRLMWERVGLVRDEAGLAGALSELHGLAAPADAEGDAGRASAGPEPPAAPAPPVPGVEPAGREAVETANLLTVGRLVATAARARRESRGAHWRDDHPAEDPAWRRRLYLAVRPDGGVELTPGPALEDEWDAPLPARRPAPPARAAHSTAAAAGAASSSGGPSGAGLPRAVAGAGGGR